MTEHVDWAEYIPNVIRTPYSIYKHRKLIQKYWTHLKVSVNRGSTEILVLGRPGTGKTVLTDLLDGEASRLSYALPSISSKVEARAVRIGEWHRLVRVVPGQTSTERRLALTTEFNENIELNGIIYVVDWGFNLPHADSARRFLLQNEKLDDLDKLRAYNLEKELEDFKEVARRIIESYQLTGKPKWLIIAVNKVDLFYNQVLEAEKYYNSLYDSPFTAELKKIIRTLGEVHFSCATLPISATSESFNWVNRKTETNIGGTQNSKQLALGFINEISKLWQE